MKNEKDRKDTRIQARVPEDVKTDLRTLGESKGYETLGSFIAYIATLYRNNQKRRGKC